MTDAELDLAALAAALGVARRRARAANGRGEYVVRAPGTPTLVAELACHLRDLDVRLERAALRPALARSSVPRAHVGGDAA